MRPLACGSCMRRFTFQALCRLRRAELRRAAGDNQFAMGRQAGIEQLFRHLQADFEDRPDQVLVKLAIKNALGCIDRSIVTEALKEALSL